MTRLELIVEPDPRFNRISDRLRRKSEQVTEVTPEHQQLARDMFERMLEESGVGLAAPQVGHYIRLIVARIPAGYAEDISEDVDLILFNPEIVKAGGRETDFEGCLSFPDLLGPVERYSWAIVRGHDIEGNNDPVSGERYRCPCFAA